LLIFEKNKKNMKQVSLAAIERAIEVVDNLDDDQLDNMRALGLID
jgi:hypothetical protein